MQPDGDTSAQLATFDPPLAQAVVTVLRRAGVPAATEPLDHGEAEVRVPSARRDEALDILTRDMEQVRELVGTQDDRGRRTVDAGGDTDGTARTLPLDAPPDDDSGRPIVMERLRRMGMGLAVILAPLLIITLSGPNLPMGYALALFVAGLVAVVYWRSRQED